MLVENIIKTKKLMKIKILGINYGEITLGNYLWIKKNFRGIKLMNVSKPIARARCIKDEMEIKLLKKRLEHKTKLQVMQFQQFC